MGQAAALTSPADPAALVHELMEAGDEHRLLAPAKAAGRRQAADHRRIGFRAPQQNWRRDEWTETSAPSA
jgi:hypothetical protein